MSKLVDVRNVHLDMPRQFEQQRQDMLQLSQERSADMAALIAENEALRAENESLRYTY